MRTALVVLVCSVGALLAPAVRADDTRVEVRSDAHVRLETRPSASEPWRVVCADACGANLSTSGLYRVTGDGIRASSVFKLHPNGDRALVKVDTRPKGAFTAGIVLTTIGSVFLGTATAVAIYDAASPPPVGGGLNVVTFLVGTAAAILGLSTFIPGVVLLAHNGASRVEQD